MANYKNSRLAEDIKRELSVVFREVKDPRVSGILSVVRVELAGDGSECKVYVSSAESFDKAKEAVNGLRSGEGFIKHRLADRIHVRHIPRLVFIADNSIEKSSDLNRMIEDMKRNDKF